MISGLDSDDEEDADDDVPQVEDGPAVTRAGDIWTIGKHRLICGDATDPEVYSGLLDCAEAQLIFTAPPYNVPVDGHVLGCGLRSFSASTPPVRKRSYQRLNVERGMPSLSSLRLAVRCDCSTSRMISSFSDAG